MWTASCLLTTSLDGLEGPPPSNDGGVTDGGPQDGSVVDIADANIAEGDTGFGHPDSGSDRGGPIEDAPILDGDGNEKGPFPVVRVSGVLRGIAEHGTEIYWVQTGFAAGIARAPKHGMGPPGTVENTSNAFDVAVDDDYVYWSNDRNEVYRKSIQAGGSSGTFYFSGATTTLYLAAGTAGRIYVTGANYVAVGPMPDAGVGISALHYLNQPGAAGIAMFGADLFWSITAGIVHGTDEGQVEEPEVQIYAADAPGEVAGIATDGQEIFWIRSDGVVRSILRFGPTTSREVCRASAETGDAEPDARPRGDGGASTFADIAVDDQWVYFTEPAIQQITKCRKR